MGAQQIHIGVRGRIGDATARALGGRVAVTDDGFELVADYVDLAQLVGLLVRLADLHIPFHRVAVSTGTEPDHVVDPHDGTNHNRHDNPHHNRHDNPHHNRHDNPHDRSTS